MPITAAYRRMAWHDAAAKAYMPATAGCTGVF